MSETYQVDKKFIIEAHNAACSNWKIKLEKKFPDIFNKIKKGKWYKSSDINKKTLIYITDPNLGSNCGFGFDYEGNWVEKANLGLTWDCEPASHEEVSLALINEAKKRGFIKGATITNKYINGNVIFSGEFEFDSLKSLLGTAEKGGRYTIFENNSGYWASIIQDHNEKQEQAPPTQEEIDRVLNYLKLKAKQ